MINIVKISRHYDRNIMMNTIRVKGFIVCTLMMVQVCFAGAEGNIRCATTTVARPTVVRLTEVKSATPAQPPTSLKTDTLIVTCRLTEIPGRFVANDAYDYVYIMKYRVIAVEKGSYAGKEILVGHYNPLIARKLIKDKMDACVDGTVDKFIVGDKHRLTLVAPIDALWKNAIEDEYIDSELEKYFAIKADVVK
jgi:hypothetical protein